MHVDQQVLTILVFPPGCVTVCRRALCSLVVLSGHRALCGLSVPKRAQAKGCI